MSNPGLGPTFTTEFGDQFEAERAQWLRRRFLWYTGIIGGLNVLSAVAAGIMLLAGRQPDNLARTAAARPSAALALELALTAMSAALYWGAFITVRRVHPTREQLLRSVMFLIVGTGFLQLLVSLVSARADTDPMSVGQGWILAIFVSHLLACIFLPLTPSESFRPIAPLLAVNAIFVLVSNDSWLTKTLGIALSPLIAVPGAAICWWRHSRFRELFTLRVLRGRYNELKAELTNARTIHESLFPKPLREGPVRFSYVYEPMRQIGGDYLFVCQTPGAASEWALNIVLIDVTGHGIPAALTVNRLHGELERIFAEDPSAGPGEVLSLLNRYVHLTLATHSVYVTAVCFRVDPGVGTVRYASGGHPPAFLRSVDGAIDQLDSTTFVLGACAPSDFHAEERTLPFMPGDTLIAYTDGATDARDSRGKFLRVQGIQKIIATARPDLNGGWPATILRAVENHRQGPAADDTLVLEIYRPLETVPAKTPKTSIATPARVG